MVKIRALAPLSHPTTGEQFAPDAVVDVADDVAREWRAAGKVALIEDEERNAAAATHYGDVVGREDVGQVQRTTQQPGPQADDDEDDENRRKKGKK